MKIVSMINEMISQNEYVKMSMENLNNNLARLLLASGCVGITVFLYLEFTCRRHGEVKGFQQLPINIKKQKIRHQTVCYIGAVTFAFIALCYRLFLHHPCSTRWRTASALLRPSIGRWARTIAPLVYLP